MREIKFRVFDGDKMISFGNAVLHELVSFQVNGEEVRAEYDFVHIMQYTGLQDKNGKEIYDGDIVSIGCEIAEEEIIPKVVFWDEKDLGFRLENIRKDIEGRAWSFFIDSFGEIEIIGNIYENPELVDVK